MIQGTAFLMFLLVISQLSCSPIGGLSKTRQAALRQFQLLSPVERLCRRVQVFPVSGGSTCGELALLTRVARRVRVAGG